MSLGFRPTVSDGRDHPCIMLTNHLFYAAFSFYGRCLMRDEELSLLQHELIRGKSWNNRFGPNRKTDDQSEITGQRFSESEDSKQQFSGNKSIGID